MQHQQQHLGFQTTSALRPLMLTHPSPCQYALGFGRWAATTMQARRWDAPIPIPMPHPTSQAGEAVGGHAAVPKEVVLPIFDRLGAIHLVGVRACLHASCIHACSAMHPLGCVHLTAPSATLPLKPTNPAASAGPDGRDWRTADIEAWDASHMPVPAPLPTYRP